jgi:ribose transport system substrate-binding protein
MSTLRGKGLVLAAVALLFALPTFAAPVAIYIPVISKGFQHQFWQTVKAGAEAAANQYKVVITFEGPPTESDIQQQVQMLSNDLAKNPSAICLAALDVNSVTDQLKEAIRRKIPIIGFDSGVPNAPKGAIYATAATNSYAAAALAADHMFDAVKDKIAAATADSPVTIIDFNQDATSQSVTDRGKGFRDEMIKRIVAEGGHRKSDIRVQGNPAYIAKDSPTSGKAIIIDVVVPPTTRDPDLAAGAQAILGRVESDNILGIFCSNEGTARALITASNDGSSLPSQYPGLIVIGFDAGAAQKAAVRNKYFFGAITQDPYNIGSKAVELAYRAIKGQKVKDIDTGAHFYDDTNMDDPAIARLLYD